MILPKIEFRYSWIYDEKYRGNKRIQKMLEKRGIKYHSQKVINNHIKKVKLIWIKIERKIFKELSIVSGLKWKENKIIVYVVGYGIPFSDPLTMPVYNKDMEYFIDTLIHELIHQLFTQKGNMEKSRNTWDYFFRKYKKESETTIIHIPLHAIHSHIFYKFFNERRLKKDIKGISHILDYTRSWDIVKKEGYKKIISEFRNGLKK